MPENASIYQLDFKIKLQSNYIPSLLVGACNNKIKYLRYDLPVCAYPFTHD